jgi:hypothetical protein
MTLLLILILVLLIFGGGGTYYGRRAGWSVPRYGGGLIGLLVLLLIVWLIVSAIDAPSMPVGTAPISTAP